jgi:hypothetical protein
MTAATSQGSRLNGQTSSRLVDLRTLDSGFLTTEPRARRRAEIFALRLRNADDQSRGQHSKKLGLLIAYNSSIAAISKTRIFEDNDYRCSFLRPTRPPYVSGSSQQLTRD